MVLAGEIEDILVEGRLVDFAFVKLCVDMLCKEGDTSR